MKATVKCLGTAILVASLSGCVIHVNDDNEFDYDDWDDTSASDNWQERQRYNRRAIRELAVGDEINNVMAQMGDPDFMDVFMRDATEVRVLRYRTQHERSDGVTSEDETTPLVFEDGLLVGWGELSYQRATGQ